MRGTLIAAMAVLVCGAAAGQENESAPLRVTGVRHWSLEGVTRLAIDVTGEFRYRSDRLHNPERVFFDILRASPSFGGKRAYRTEVGDRLLQKVRVAETMPGITRIVLDLAGPVEYTASQMSNPDRLVIELRPGPPVVAPELAPEPAPGAPSAESKPAPKPLELPAEQPAPAPALQNPPPVATPPASARTPASVAAVAAGANPPARTPPPPPKTLSPGDSARAAAHTADGKNSLIRALGLKINRVVIDPGHGGHDQGTVGRRGLMEKELVLDVAKRLGQLIEQQIGCEVFYTRTEDSFVPLEGRTSFANDKRADLFVSLHANSSPLPRIAGTETFYLNFTTSRDALDVASRENASSQKSVSELQDLLQKIARQEKIDESKELAGRLQASMFTFSARYNPGIRNRGVKKAPFVVLVGAQMPSVLVEIGFLSNSREETLLKRPDHRQKVAEALLRGIFRYTQSLSHFQVAASPAALDHAPAASK